MASYSVGDQVTVMPPWDQDPIIISMQHYVRVAEVLADDAVMVTLPAAWPPDERFGPFPAHRLTSGWRDQRGRWR